MARPGAAPLPEQLAILFLGPPIMALVLKVMMRGWARTVQGATVSARTERRQKLEFWVVLVVMYVMVFGMAIYAWLT